MYSNREILFFLVPFLKIILCPKMFLKYIVEYSRKTWVMNSLSELNHPSLDTWMHYSEELDFINDCRTLTLILIASAFSYPLEMQADVFNVFSVGQSILLQYVVPPQYQLAYTLLVNRNNISVTWVVCWFICDFS